MNNNNAVLIDKYIKQLSRMQVGLLNPDMTPADYNTISEMIGELKEFMVNCDSYNKANG